MGGREKVNTALVTSNYKSTSRKLERYGDAIPGFLVCLLFFKGDWAGFSMLDSALLTSAICR